MRFLDYFSLQSASRSIAMTACSVITAFWLADYMSDEAEGTLLLHLSVAAVVQSMTLFKLHDRSMRLEREFRKYGTERNSELVVRLAIAGKSVAEIAQLTGMSTDGVRYAVRSTADQLTKSI